MTTIQAVQHVMENGCSLMRPRKDTPHDWDVKEAFQGNKRGWVLMDATTANMLQTIYNALGTEESKAKFNRIPLMRLIDFGWKQVRP